MKTALCKVCQVTGVLCTSCERELRTGKITSLDVDISIYLGRAAKDKKELDTVSFKRALYIDNYLVLIFKKGDLRLMLSHGKKIIRDLEEKFGRKVYLVEDHPNFREFIEGLLYPVPVETINIIWLPDGSKETRIVLRKRLRREKERLVKSIVKELRGVDVKLGYMR
jgi:transcription antitermination factor NusA-like protein